METYSSNRFAIKGKTARTRVYKNHLKMVKGCRIDTGSCKKPLSKKDSPPSPVPVLQLTLVPRVFGESFFDNGFLHDPVSILHPFTIFKWFLYTLIYSHHIQCRCNTVLLLAYLTRFLSGMQATKLRILQHLLHDFYCISRSVLESGKSFNNNNHCSNRQPHGRQK